MNDADLRPLIRMFPARRSTFADNIEKTHVEPSDLIVRCLHHDANKPPASEIKDVHEMSPSAMIAL